ncbi:MAG: 4-hydroxy-3-methylbut-2-enyl diphosphate reductase [Gammaproteobacteria bacterium]|nr:4-hydroxy-3-methylbut-2-enyl diphosphate reductase [Gammaproteobacteria bacterium]
MNAILARPRGFCAGVVRAIEIVERALEIYGSPVYVLHEIVHNRYVVDNLRKRGTVFVESLEEMPAGCVCIFSAHGVAERLVKQAEDRRLRVIDATCPLVTRVHSQAQRYHSQGLELIIIGHSGHPEVEGTRGRVDAPMHVLCTVPEAAALQTRNPEKLAYVTQTTLSVDDTRDVIETLKRRFPSIQGSDVKDICYATQSRQNAVRKLAADVDILLVVGASNSSNSNRLREVAERASVDAWLIEDAGDIQPQWLAGKTKAGITAGASAPEILVTGVVARLQELGVETVEEMPGEPETTTFKMPAVLYR